MFIRYVDRICMGTIFIRKATSNCTRHWYVCPVLGLLTSTYKRGNQIPMLGYLIVLMFCMGLLTFVVNSTGGHRGAFFFLSSIITSVLQVIVGYYLQKTPFARLGKYIIVFPTVLFLSMVLLSPYATMIVDIINTSVLVCAFYKEPLLMR